MAKGRARYTAHTRRQARVQSCCCFWHDIGSCWRAAEILFFPRAPPRTPQMIYSHTARMNPPEKRSGVLSDFFTPPCAGGIFPRVFFRVFHADLREKSRRATDRIRHSRKFFFRKSFSGAPAAREEAIALKPCTREVSRGMSVFVRARKIYVQHKMLCRTCVETY
jgi:hypothetical protein